MHVPPINPKLTGYKFRIKAKDLQVFNDVTKGQIEKECFKNPNIKTLAYVTENPDYIDHQDFHQEVESTNWALTHLKLKGFNVKKPPSLEHNGAIDFYLFTDQKVAKKYLRRFEPRIPIRSFINQQISIFSSIPQVKKFKKTVNRSIKNDPLFNTAKYTLKSDIANKKYQQMFDKFLKKNNATFQEIEYKPTVEDREQAAVCKALKKYNLEEIFSSNEAEEVVTEHIKKKKTKSFAKKHKAQKKQNAPIDGYKFKIQAKDWDVFNDVTMHDIEYRAYKKGERVSSIIESPIHETYQDIVEEEPMSNWAIKNLQNKGFDIDSPVEIDEDKTVNVYVLKNQNIRNKFLKRFDLVKEKTENPKTKPRVKLDYWLGRQDAKKKVREYKNTISAPIDNDHKMAMKFLIQDHLDKYMAKVMDKFFKRKRAHIKEIDYKPTQLMRDKAKAVQELEKAENKK